MPLSSFSHSLALRSHHSCFPFASFPILPFLPLHYRSTNDQIQLMLIMLLILADTGNSSGLAALFLWGRALMSTYLTHASYTV